MVSRENLLYPFTKKVGRFQTLNLFFSPSQAQRSKESFQVLSSFLLQAIEWGYDKGQIYLIHGWMDRIEFCFVVRLIGLFSQTHLGFEKIYRFFQVQYDSFFFLFVNYCLNIFYFCVISGYVSPKISLASPKTSESIFELQQNNNENI